MLFYLFFCNSHCIHPAFTIVSFSPSFPSPAPTRVWCLLRARALFCSYCYATTSFEQRCLAFSQCMSEWGPHRVHSCCVHRGSRHHFLCGLPVYPTNSSLISLLLVSPSSNVCKRDPCRKCFRASLPLSLSPLSRPFMY